MRSESFGMFPGKLNPTKIYKLEHMMIEHVRTRQVSAKIMTRDGKSPVITITTNTAGDNLEVPYRIKFIGPGIMKNIILPPTLPGATDITATEKVVDEINIAKTGAVEANLRHNIMQPQRDAARNR